MINPEEYFSDEIPHSKLDKRRIEGYELYHPPFAIRYEDMTLAQSIENMEFYRNQTKVRIEMLAQAMRSCGYESPLDFSQNSLVTLGKWFCESVGTRFRTLEETNTLKADTPVQFQKYVSDWEIDYQSISIAHDVGLYFTAMLERKFPRSSWDVVRKPKNDVQFRHPILLLPTKVGGFCPIWVMLILAGAFASGHRTSDRLANLFDVWSETFSSDV